jgi:hypothetical protein
MATSRPFAYNTGASISGTTRFGSLIVGDINADYGSDYGGVKWWGGPDEDLRYIIGTSRPGGQPVPPGVGGTAQVGFWGTPLGDKTDSAFLNLANYVGSLSSQPPFATTNDAVTWLNANGYYTSYTSITPTPTATLGLTPTPTGTPVAETPTPTPTETEVLTPTPTETEVLTPTPTETETPTPTPTETEVLTPTPTETEVLTPTPTETPTPTPTPTGTEVLTPTPTPTETEVLTPTPTETEVLTPTPTETETPTPTPTETPTNTPSITLTGETPTPTPTPTSTDLSSITTYSISGCTNLNVLVVDLGPGFIVLGDVNYYTFTGATPSGCYSVISKINAPIDDAFTTSFGTGGCNDCESTYITPTPTPTNTETPTPTPTETEVLTPTPTETETPTPTPTPTETEVLTPTPTETETPTPTPTETEVLTPTPTETETPTPTPTETPTNTPTPSTTPIPVTGYGYNLVVLPYAPPTSGNTIFPRFSVTGETSGVTTPNTFDVNGVFWNSIDNLSVDRTSYYSGMTGTSVTAYFTQNGDTAIYSGSSTAFTFEGSPGTFNYNPNTRPGQLTLIQSASTDFVTGQTVYISYVVN